MVRQLKRVVRPARTEFSPDWRIIALSPGQVCRQTCVAFPYPAHVGLAVVIHALAGRRTCIAGQQLPYTMLGT